MRPRSVSAVRSLATQTDQIDVSYASGFARVGACVGRRYRLEELLDDKRTPADDIRRGWEGLYSWPGNVWRAQHVARELPVAIKFLDPAIAEDEALLDGFFWELRAAAALSNEHATKILDCGIEAGTPYYVMELLEGETLEQRLIRRTLSTTDLNRIFAEASSALQEAHDLGVIHRDLKPANLFLTPARGRETTKLLFGIAKIMNDTLELVRKMANHAVAPPETVAYMSPEQVLGKSTLDHRSDLWSLAVVAFECMTGRLPFPGLTLGDRLVRICTAAPLLPSEVCAVPTGFDAWFMRGVSKLPGERFGSALEMSEALTRLLVPHA